MPQKQGYREVKKEGRPQSSPNSEQPDWNEINLGKCRHAFLLAAFKDGTTVLDQYVVDQSNEWAYVSMYGTLRPPKANTPPQRNTDSQGSYPTDDDYQPPCPTDDDIPF